MTANSAKSCAIVAHCILLMGLRTAATEGQASHPKIHVGPNLRVSDNILTGGRNECWISASSTDPGFLIGVSQESLGKERLERGRGTGSVRLCATSISRNGGQTWREITLPGQEDACFDPMTATASDGRTYVLQTMMGRRLGPQVGGSSQDRKGTIRIWSTSDQGRTWSGPTDLKCPVAPDHPRMVVDNSGGPRDGRLYISWNEISDTFLKDKYHIFLHYSDDQGETFGEPILVDTMEGGKLVATEPIVLSDGTLLVTHYQYYWPLSSEKNESQPVFLLRSEDGGETFGEREAVATVGSSAWRHLRKDFGESFTLPIFAADTFPDSPYRDRIYMVWNDVRGGASNIWLIASTDEGRSWTDPVRINDNPAGGENGPPDFRMTPVVAVNRYGDVGVAWYDRRDDPARRCWHQYFTASLDGGESFFPNVAISSEPSCPSGYLPTVYTWNVSPYFEDTLPSNQELASLPDRVRLRLEEEVGIAMALREEGIQTAKIRVAFDVGRAGWAGHYTGLTAGKDGRFHALWVDRRNGLRQLFTSEINVAKEAARPNPETQEATVTDLVKVIGGPAEFDEANSVVEFELQVRNVSEQVIYAPLRLVVSDVAGPSSIFVDPDEHESEDGAVLDFTHKLGTRGRLEPKAISEAKRVTIRVRAETGLDRLFDFKVLGHLARSKGTDGDPRLERGQNK